QEELKHRVEDALHPPDGRFILGSIRLSGILHGLVVHVVDEHQHTVQATVSITHEFYHPNASLSWVPAFH
ncbi:hypothetical protein PENTCL1PPCAC_20824, partial [Pristionchus entomophagus]